MTHTKTSLYVLDAQDAGRFTVLAVSPLSVVVQIVVSKFYPKRPNTEHKSSENRIHVSLTNVQLCVIKTKDNFEFHIASVRVLHPLPSKFVI